MGGKCQLCATPDVHIENGMQVCAGCGSAPVWTVVNYKMNERMGLLVETTFEYATIIYESSPNYNRHLSFGEWLAMFGLKLIAKP